MHTIEVKRNGEWMVLTTVRPEVVGGKTETPFRTLERARSMLRRWAETFWSIRGENAELRLV